MAVQVVCPCCDKALSSPEDMAGKQAECPYCSVRFQVPDFPAGSEPSQPIQGTLPPTPPPMPASNAGMPGGKAPLESVSMQSGAPPAPPPVATPPPVSRNHGAGSGGLETVSMGPTATPPVTRPSSPAAPPPGPPSRPKSARPKTSLPAKSRKAKLITADAAQSRVQLGADGNLPELVLAEGVKQEKAAESSGSSNSLVIVAFCVSVGMSVLMLFVDTDSRQSETKSRRAARENLKLHYIEKPPPFEPYQLLLRRAQQARSRGDIPLERRLYRRVLDMLHAESNNEPGGLTGRGGRDVTTPPSDAHLIDTLNTLLSN